MGILDMFKKNEREETYTPIIANPLKYLGEAFKGQVEQNKIIFPKELGVEHPFNFKELEGLYKKFGFFTAVVDKYIDFVWGGGFYVECENEKAKKIIEDFMRDVNFDTIGRQWTKEALVKGNGFIEIGGDADGSIKGLKILDANNMYVNRDNKGKVLGYKQYTGGLKRFQSEKIINFKPNSIAHVPFNRIGDMAYGLGIGFPVLKGIDNLLQEESDLHMLMGKKANAPIHAKLGLIQGDTKIYPKPEDVEAFGKRLETLKNVHEWATGPDVEFKVIDYGNIGEKFSAVLEHDLNMLIYAFQIPGVLLGMANIPEGLAKVQMEAFQRRIQSMQAELEKIIEENIFKRVLNANGFSEEHIEFEWGTPSVIEVEGRMTLLKELISSPASSMAMKKIVEDELITLLKLDADEWEQLKLEMEEKQEEERKRLEAQPQPRVPGQNASFPKAPAPKPVPKPAVANQMADIENIIIKTLEKVQPKKDAIKNRKIFREKFFGNAESEEVEEKIIAKKPIKKSDSFKQSYEIEKECPHCTEMWGNIEDVSEWLGFNYKEYLSKIIEATKEYDFEFLIGITEEQIKAGYLTEVQIGKLRKVLETGFKKGQSMTEMASAVKKNVDIKDLYRLNEDGTIKVGAAGLPILARSADKRPIGIVRTEVTRLANMGAEKNYADNGIKQVSWVASFGERTCQACEDLNGQIFKLNEHPDIPLHPLCRCTLAPVTELK